MPRKPLQARYARVPWPGWATSRPCDELTLCGDPPGRRQEQSMKAAPSAHLVRALIRGHHVATQAQRHAAGPLQLRQQLHRNQRAQRLGAKTRPAPRPAGANLRMQICTSSPAAPEWPASASPNATRPRPMARPCSSVRAVLWPLRGHASATRRGRAAGSCTAAAGRPIRAYHLLGMRGEGQGKAQKIERDNSPGMSL